MTAEDRFILCDQDPKPVTVSEVARTYHFQRDDRSAIEGVLENRSLASEWRRDLQQRLDRLP